MSEWTRVNDSGGSDFTTEELGRVRDILDRHVGLDNSIPRQRLLEEAKLHGEGRVLRAILAKLDEMPAHEGGILVAYDLKGGVAKAATLEEAEKFTRWLEAGIITDTKRLRARRYHGPAKVALQQDMFG